MSVSGCDDTSAGAASAAAAAAGSLTVTAATGSTDIASASSTETFAVSASPLQAPRHHNELHVQQHEQNTKKQHRRAIKALTLMKHIYVPQGAHEAAV
jgi:hypothetical protein